jgi:amidase/aspartyl-tRNA(Asn)/glutamyl-tRNA(Gln) amidotransferase subunit A
LDILSLDATELAQLLRQRKLSAVEAARAAIERIERLNPLVNAVVTTTIDEALDAAKEADRRAAAGEYIGPLHGLPILIKDLFDFQAGVRNTFGCPAMRDFVPDFTMAHVSRLAAAGAVILGKTNTPEFGHKGVTDNKLFGPTRCPFDLARNAGGSSGGSAAAVAVGMVPLAQGSDAGGSIRIPAAWCGVVGFKPTFGRVPNTGAANVFGLTTPFVHAGPIARTVRDVALMAQVMSGPHVDDPFSLPEDGMDLPAAAGHEAGSREQGAKTWTNRIAYSRNLGVFAVEPTVTQVVDDCVSALRNSGLALEDVEVHLPLDQDELAQLWLRQVGLIYLELFDAMAQDGPDLLSEFAEDVPAAVHAMVDMARRASAFDIRRDDTLRSQIWRTIQRVFEEYDGLLTPTLGSLPVPNATDGATTGPTRVNGRAVEPCIGWCLTHPFNFTGHPAASVPAGLTADGLPVGLQGVGRRFDDEQVIRICRRVEEVRPWMGALATAYANVVSTLRVP